MNGRAKWKKSATNAIGVGANGKEQKYVIS